MLSGRSTVAPDAPLNPDTGSRADLLAHVGAAALTATRVPSPDPCGSVAALDAVLDALGTGGSDPGLRALVLRHSLVARLHLAAEPAPDADPDGVVPGGVVPGGLVPGGPVPGGPDPAVDAQLDELLALVAEHGLSLLAADAQMLLARRALLDGDEDAALAAASTGLAHLEEPVLVDHAATVAEHRANLLCSRRLAASTLVSLGMHDLAEVLVDQAGFDGGDDSGDGDLSYERVRLGVSWGLRLERAGRRGEDRLREAADVAERMQHRAAPAERPLLRAAAVLARAEPGVATRSDERDAARRDAADLAGDEPVPSQHDRLITRLARARALERAGDPEAAAALLARVRARPPRGEASLMLSVTRELARVRSRPGGTDGGARPVDAAVRDYLADLEEELWALHRARALSLHTRLAHDRLRREHGQVTALALADPLTGLPNRRALDRCLDEVLAEAAHRGPGPAPAVAMIDVDGFKRVNDTISHARGDEVLRGVATALRSSLRAPDLVARYGGDEFVVVLPETAVEDACAALGRARAAVPGPVTLSIGVVAARPGEGAADVLARADGVMYAAKRAGGDAVRTAP